MRHPYTTWIACTALLLGSAAAQADNFSFTGRLADGPLAGLDFSGSYSYDARALQPGGDFETPLTGFSMLLNGQTYNLLSADYTPTAEFAGGTFAGLSYRDADAADPGQRAWVNFTPGYDTLAQAYLAYTGAPDALGADSGYGSYGVAAVVPEPASVMLLMAGLGAVAGFARRRAAGQTPR